jgi:hypothetical protein
MLTVGMVVELGGSFTCNELLIYACRQCVPGLQGCGKKKGSNTLRETCMSYVEPVIAQVSICIERTGCRPPPPSSTQGKAGRDQLNEEITPLLPTGIGEELR